MAESTGFQLQGSGPQRYERYVAPIMAPFVAAVIRHAALNPGARVLDVACGTGFVARAVRDALADGGTVTGVDLNPGMLEQARAAAPDIDWHQAPADALPFPDGSFDAVLCQQGMQFFPDLDAAVAECARVLAPGGRLVATVWAPLERSPYFQAQQAVAAAIGGPEEGADFAAAFACSADRLTGAFSAAGLGQVTVEELRPEITLPPLEQFVAGHFSALPWGSAIGTDPEARARALQMMADALREALKDRTAPDGSVTLPFTSVLVRGVR